MSKISEIDKNFAIQTNIKKEGIVWHNAKTEPFRIFGLLTESDGYTRIPVEVAETVSEGVTHLNRHISGGRVAFESTSSYIAISTTDDEETSSNMALLGSGGFDVYIDEGMS